MIGLRAMTQMCSGWQFLKLGVLLISWWIGAASAQVSPRIPLTDSSALGLYDASNVVPAGHDAVGRARAAEVTPRDRDGIPAAGGKIVLLSIGMSNTSLEWCGARSNCRSPLGNSFMALAAGSGAVNHSTLAIVNGAEGSETALMWTSPSAPAYDSIRDTRLEPAGLSEMQVQAVWLKNASSYPMVSLPNAAADAYNLEAALGATVRALRVRYPNLKLVFLSSRIYAGYAPPLSLNPEPFAYESGFAVKWLISAQIAQMLNGGVSVDTHAGDLNYNTVAPWIVWGPYLWANGTTPRSDGLTWSQSDFSSDETHPSPAGIAKIAARLMDFFAGSPYTQCWFAVGATGCGTPTPTVTLSSLSLNPSEVSGGTLSTGTVALSGAAPSGGIAVLLSSGNNSAAAVPASVTVPADANSASFSVTTSVVTTLTSVTLSAVYGESTQTATLTIDPLPETDTVSVTLATYDASRRRLSIQATSTKATARLSAYVTSNNQLIGALRNIGGGNYSGQFSRSTNPQNVTVRSTSGGSASRAVTVQ